MASTDEASHGPLSEHDNSVEGGYCTRLAPFSQVMGGLDWRWGLGQALMLDFLTAFFYSTFIIYGGVVLSIKKNRGPKQHFLEGVPKIQPIFFPG